jgi:tetratricopeptide (TPR) repeat protein
MDKVRKLRERGLIAAALLAVLGLVSSSTRAADEAEWKNRALALNEVTGEAPMRGQIMTLLDDPAAAKRIIAAAVPMAKEKNQPLGYNAASILARVALQLKELDASQTFFRICADQAIKLRSPAKLDQAYTGFSVIIELLYDTKEYAQSAKRCQEFLETLEKDQQNFRSAKEAFERIKRPVHRQLIRAMTKQGKFDEATKMVETLVKGKSREYGDVELRAWIAREAGRTEDAAKIYEDLLEEIGNDKALKSAERDRLGAQVHYILSGVYVDMDQIDKASAHLKTLLEKKPNDPTFNNDLGYIWADHDMNLDEAEKMIRKAIDEDRKQRRKAKSELKPEEDKDNAAYLDSLGWVLFKKKKFQEAKPILQKAAEDKEGQHIEILDHLAEVHLALGEKDEAISVWKKALEVAGDSKREQEKKVQVEKKIKENQ